MKLKSNISVFALILMLSLSAQNTDTLEIAKQLYTQKSYSKAASILHLYLKRHPQDVYVNWLYGQIAHERGYNALSGMLFQRAIKYDPENTELKLNYIRSLFYSRQLTKAQKELKELINEENDDSTQLESYLMLAYIDFWNQKYKSANNYVDKILEKNPEDKLANQLKQDILYATSPYAKLNLDYLGDNQRLNSFSETIEVGVNKNEYLNPKLLVNNQNFDTDKQVLIASVGNTFSFSEYGLSLYLAVGGYKHFSDGLGWVGEAELKKKLGKYLSAKAGINRLPYLYTLKSTYSQVFENNVYGRIEYENPKLLSVNALYQHKFFDDNHIDVFGGWVLSKYFKINFFEFRAGYGFSYSNSKDILYYPENDNLETIPLGTQISGIYNPYFTPKKQEIHSLIAAFKFHFTPKLSLDLSGTYAFYAKNDAPILFSNQDTAGNYIYEKYFYKEENHPYDIKVSVGYTISDRLSLSAYYQYQENSFYNQNRAGAAFFYKL